MQAAGRLTANRGSPSRGPGLQKKHTGASLRHVPARRGAKNKTKLKKKCRIREGTGRAATGRARRAAPHRTPPLPCRTSYCRRRLPAPARCRRGWRRSRAPARTRSPRPSSAPTPSSAAPREGPDGEGPPGHGGRGKGEEGTREGGTRNWQRQRGGTGLSP